MELRAQRASEYAKTVFDLHRSFRVLARFRHAIDLEAPSGAIVALQAQGTSFTPLTVAFAADTTERLLSAPVGSRVELDLLVEETVDCRLPSGTTKPEAWDTLLRKLLGVLGRFEGLAALADVRLWDALEEPNALQHEAWQWIVAANRYVEEGCAAGVSASLANLAGMGPGLTPAGDDFLLGVLAACQYQTNSFTQKLADDLRQRLPPLTTGRLSAALLERALAGEFSLAIRDVLQASTACELAWAAGRCVSYGHTSGSDLLGGLCWMMSKGGHS